jgi:hypothetical protein
VTDHRLGPRFSLGFVIRIGIGYSEQAVRGIFRISLRSLGVSFNREDAKTGQVFRSHDGVSRRLRLRRWQSPGPIEMSAVTAVLFVQMRGSWSREAAAVECGRALESPSFAHAQFVSCRPLCEEGAGFGLLVIASFNHGETRLIRKLDSLPNDPKERISGISTSTGGFRRETRKYVMWVFSAVFL